LTSAEQRHPDFKISYRGHECQWNGPSWPYATTITLRALSNLLNDYENTAGLTELDYLKLIKQYASAHKRILEDGREVFWIDENFNPYTGDWISRTRLKNWNNSGWSSRKGGRERGKDYNHSGFCDLIISDLIGIKPDINGVLSIRPLITEESWDWFALTGLKIQGQLIDVVWDKDGLRYGGAIGFSVYSDGKQIYNDSQLNKIQIMLDK